MSIPLTFDWLTLAWLKTRLHVWWRVGRASPRQLALLLALSLFSGCVPAVQFEETQSAAQVETEGRKRAEYQLEQLRAENAQLQAKMQQQGQVLDDRDQALSQAQLDSSTLGKQREDAEGMVEQLRGELARVGGHLQTFHDDQQKLQTALTTESARGRELARLSRDAALSMAEPIATGDYTLDAEQNAVVLRVPRDKMLTEDGSVKPEAKPLLDNVVRLMQLHKQAKLRVEDSAHEGDAVAVSRVVAALSERELGAERFEPLAVQADAAPGVAPSPSPVPPELSFAFSVL